MLEEQAEEVQVQLHHLLKMVSLVVLVVALQVQEELVEQAIHLLLIQLKVRPEEFHQDV